MKNKAYYKKADHILAKMIDSRHYLKYKSNYNRIEKLCKICIEGQKLGCLPPPKNNSHTDED